MRPTEIDRMFNIRIEKTSTEIKDQAKIKIAELQAKIAERQARITKLRTEYDIDDAALIQLLTQARRQEQSMQYQYSSTEPGSGKMTEKIIGAGAVNNLLTENDFIEAEKAMYKRLELILRNISPLTRTTTAGVKYHDDSFVLNYEELELLGF